MSQQSSMDSLQKCAVNSFSSDTEYLRNCCTGREPYISEYIQKRCNELHLQPHTNIQSSENRSNEPFSSEISVYYKE